MSVNLVLFYLYEFHYFAIGTRPAGYYPMAAFNVGLQYPEIIYLSNVRLLIVQIDSFQFKFIINLVNNN